MAYTYCPRCATELVTRRLDEHDRQVCPHCSFIHYPTSSPCVGVLVVQERKLLLVERAIEPFRGYWDIPGGFLDAGEHPAEGAAREMREETGLIVEPTEILGIWMDTYGEARVPTLNICYIATPTGGEPRAGSDAAGLRWHRLDDLPRNIAFAWEREALEVLRRRMGQ